MIVDSNSAIKVLNEHLEHWQRLLEEKICDKKEGQTTIETFKYAIENLKKVDWLITEYEHEVDLLEQDLNDNSGCPTVTDVVVPSAKLGVYNRVLKDLKGDGEE